MKDKHIVILWGASTIVFSVWLTSVLRKGEDYIECFGIGALIFQFILAAYTLIIPIINGILREYVSYRYKLPVKNKFKDKKTPIYELQFSYLNGTYGISKWELKWCDSNNWFLPFSALFQTYKYVEVGKHGIFFEEDFKTLNSLRKVYEDMDKTSKAVTTIKLSAKDKLKQKINSLNKEFAENYE